MKIYPLAILVFVGLVAVARAADPSDYKVESRNRAETFTSKIVKVYEFKEDGIDYVAYVVNWRGHEVVVQPAIIGAEEKHHSVGDVLRCTMMEHIFPGPDGKTITHTTFMAAPTRFVRPTLPSDVGDTARLGETIQQQHLDAVSSEFIRAQSQRDTDQSTPPPQPTVTPPSK